MKKTVYSITTFTLILLAYLPSQAADEGAHVAEFLSHGVGARALGMGSAFVAIADDVTATYWNPAGLTKINKNGFSTMYSDTFRIGGGSFFSRGLVSYNFVNYIHQIQGIGSLGLSWIRQGIDNIPRTTFIDVDNNGMLGDFHDLNGNGVKDEGEHYIDTPTVAEYFSNADNALLISYAREIYSLISIGGNVKLLRQSIYENSGRGFGLDIGFLLTPYRGIQIGVLLLDATGTQIRWDTSDRPTFTRERRLRFGAAYQFTFPSFGKGCFDIDFETDQTDLAEGTESNAGVLIRIGTEYLLFDILALRCGWNGRGFTAGTGLQLNLSSVTFFVDYAFNSHALGASQRISVSGEF